MPFLSAKLLTSLGFYHLAFCYLLILYLFLLNRPTSVPSPAPTPAPAPAPVSSVISVCVFYSFFRYLVSGLVCLNHGMCLLILLFSFDSLSFSGIICLIRSESDVYGQAASNLVAGNNLEGAVQQILDMGGGSWDRDTVVRALRAAYNNPERAVEYLYTVSFVYI